MVNGAFWEISFVAGTLKCAGDIEKNKIWSHDICNLLY